MVTLAGVSGIALSIVILILSVLFIGGVVIGFIFLYKNWKRFNEFSCIIWEENGFGQLTETRDKAGIFVDSKTNNKRFFIKKANVGLDPDKVPYVPTIGGGYFSAPKTVYLYRTGLKNFHFIKPNIQSPKITLTVGEEDVNWAINAYDRQKKLFSTSKLMQFLPYIAIAFVSIIILVMFIYFFKEFGTLKEMAVEFKEVAKILKQIKLGTNII